MSGEVGGDGVVVLGEGCSGWGGLIGLIELLVAL